MCRIPWCGYLSIRHSVVMTELVVWVVLANVVTLSLLIGSFVAYRRSPFYVERVEAVVRARRAIEGGWTSERLGGFPEWTDYVPLPGAILLLGLVLWLIG